MRLALYQPDIPQNLGAAIRVAACFAASLDVIEPAGFPLTDKALKRAALDYGPLVPIERHASFASFLAHPARTEGRLVLIETDGEHRLDRFPFAAGDTLLLGRESAGSPLEAYQSAAATVRIPIAKDARSLNVAVAAAVALSEAMRQTGLYETLA
ncbi:MAG: tRNA (cytidine(34)-2'-O)-methyltransferase [Hyphomonadaceae bacterium]